MKTKTKPVVYVVLLVLLAVALFAVYYQQFITW